MEHFLCTNKKCPLIQEGNTQMLYTQITNDERNIIDHLYNFQKKSINFIARSLGRSTSSISREIKRNTIVGKYAAVEADKKANYRKWHKHAFYLMKYSEFTDVFSKMYDKKCHGIEATCIKIGKLYPDMKQPTTRQVFNWVKDSRWVIKKSQRLRQYYKKGGKRTVGIYGKFKDKYVLPIWLRPKSIDLRQEYGHWEVDLIIGKREHGFHNLLTLTEKMTRENYIVKIATKNPMKCNSAIYKLIKSNDLIVKTITCDNGIEFEKIGLLAHWVNCKVYFCEPYASYQRGSNEHANGLVRRWFKKGTNFSEVSNEEIDKVQNMINNMPRKLFNWSCSSEIAKLYK